MSSSVLCEGGTDMSKEKLRIDGKIGALFCKMCGTDELIEGTSSNSEAHITKLPPELLLAIFKNLDIVTATCLGLSCKELFSILLELHGSVKEPRRIVENDDTLESTAATQPILPGNQIFSDGKLLSLFEKGEAGSGRDGKKLHVLLLSWMTGMIWSPFDKTFIRRTPAWTIKVVKPKWIEQEYLRSRPLQVKSVKLVVGWCNEHRIARFNARKRLFEELIPLNQYPYRIEYRNDGHICAFPFFLNERKEISILRAPV